MSSQPSLTIFNVPLLSKFYVTSDPIRIVFGVLGMLVSGPSINEKVFADMLQEVVLNVFI